MSRFPPTPTSQLPEDLKPYGAHHDDNIPRAFGGNGEIMTYQDSKGAFIGPWPILIASKEVGLAFGNMFTKFPQLSSSFPDDAKETVILVVGAKFQCTFERYAHRRIAVKTAGLTKEQVADLAEGRKPKGLSEKAALAFDVAYHLAYTGGPLPDQLWEKSVKTFGKDGTLHMAHYIGIYAYVSVLLNVADVPVPEGEKMEDDS